MVNADGYYVVLMVNDDGYPKDLSMHILCSSCVYHMKFYYAIFLKILNHITKNKKNIQIKNNFNLYHIILYYFILLYYII